jgi:MOSC domain
MRFLNCCLLALSVPVATSMAAQDSDQSNYVPGATSTGDFLNLTSNAHKFSCLASPLLFDVGSGAAFDIHYVVNDSGSEIPPRPEGKDSSRENAETQGAIILPRGAARPAPSHMAFTSLEQARMWQGTVESIHVADKAQDPTRTVDRVTAIPGAGLDGDRYARQQGTFSKPEPDYELTLIEAEAIEALQRDYDIDLRPGDARRNLVTRGVPLNHLVGREFRIGDVKIRGLRLCEPCRHLESLTAKPVIKGLRHRGGLRAQILTSGTIQVGDIVTE